MQSGIDHAALRRLKQLEQERALLLRGLEAVEAATEWYRDRVATVQDGMRWLGRAGARVVSCNDFQVSPAFINMDMKLLLGTMERIVPRTTRNTTGSNYRS